jgi:hypothetical protein
MASLPEIEGSYYADIRLRNVVGRPPEWVVGVQWRKGWAVVRVTGGDLGETCAEAVAQAKVVGGKKR